MRSLPATTLPTANDCSPDLESMSALVGYHRLQTPAGQQNRRRPELAFHLVHLPDSCRI